MRIYKGHDTTGNLNRFAENISSARAKTLIGNVAVSLIQQRTALGVDQSGKKFPGYSDRRYYAPIKNRPAGYPAPSGGRRTHLRTGQPLKTVAYDSGYGEYKSAIGRGTQPQLSVSGEMLGDMQFAMWRRGVVIYFTTTLSRLKARGHHTGKYPFFGFTAGNVDQLTTEWKKYIKKAMKRAGVD